MRAGAIALYRHYPHRSERTCAIIAAHRRSKQHAKFAPKLPGDQIRIARCRALRFASLCTGWSMADLIVMKTRPNCSPHNISIVAVANDGHLHPGFLAQQLIDLKTLKFGKSNGKFTLIFV
jgi:hypothetical protein